MGRTNIHRASSLFNRSEYFHECIAYIEHAQKLVYIIKTALTQTDVDRHAVLFRANMFGSWIRKDTSAPIAYSNPDLAVQVPKIVLSSSMWDLRSRYSYVEIQMAEDNAQEEAKTETREEATLKEDDLVYILIIQGRSGDMLSKIVIEPTFDRAAAHALHEALNGYSTVFTAVILRVNVGKLNDDSYSFRAVQDLQALAMIEQDLTQRCIGFWG